MIMSPINKGVWGSKEAYFTWNCGPQIGPELIRWHRPTDWVFSLIPKIYDLNLE